MSSASPRASAPTMPSEEQQPAALYLVEDLQAALLQAWHSLDQVLPAKLKLPVIMGAAGCCVITVYAFARFFAKRGGKKASLKHRKGGKKKNLEQRGGDAVEVEKVREGHSAGPSKKDKIDAVADAESGEETSKNKKCDSGTKSSFWYRLWLNFVDIYEQGWLKKDKKLEEMRMQEAQAYPDSYFEKKPRKRNSDTTKSGYWAQKKAKKKSGSATEEDQVVDSTMPKTRPDHCEEGRQAQEQEAGSRRVSVAEPASSTTVETTGGLLVNDSLAPPKAGQDGPGAVLSTPDTGGGAKKKRKRGGAKKAATGGENANEDAAELPRAEPSVAPGKMTAEVDATAATPDVQVADAEQNHAGQLPKKSSQQSAKSADFQPAKSAQKKKKKKKGGAAIAGTPEPEEETGRPGAPVAGPVTGRAHPLGGTMVSMNKSPATSTLVSPAPTPASTPGPTPAATPKVKPGKSSNPTPVASPHKVAAPPAETSAPTWNAAAPAADSPLSSKKPAASVQSPPRTPVNRAAAEVTTDSSPSKPNGSPPMSPDNLFDDIPKRADNRGRRTPHRRKEISNHSLDSPLMITEDSVNRERRLMKINEMGSDYGGADEPSTMEDFELPPADRNACENAAPGSSTSQVKARRPSASEATRSRKMNAGAGRVDVDGERIDDDGISSVEDIAGDHGEDEEATIDIRIPNACPDEFNVREFETIEVPLGLVLECDALRRKVCEMGGVMDDVTAAIDKGSSLEARGDGTIIPGAESSTTAGTSGSSNSSKETKQAPRSSDKRKLKRKSGTVSKKKLKAAAEHRLLEEEMLRADLEHLEQQIEHDAHQNYGQRFLTHFGLPSVASVVGRVGRMLSKKPDLHKALEEKRKQLEEKLLKRSSGGGSGRGEVDADLTAEAGGVVHLEDGGDEEEEPQQGTDVVEQHEQGGRAVPVVVEQQHLEVAERRIQRLRRRLVAAISGEELDGEKISAALDFNMLTQLTYWYDRRNGLGGDGSGVDKDQSSSGGTATATSKAPETKMERKRDSKMGRWTAKISREQVVYGAVATEVSASAGGAVRSSGTGMDVASPPPPTNAGAGQQGAKKSKKKKGKAPEQVDVRSPGTQQQLPQVDDASLTARTHLGQAPKQLPHSKLFRRPRGIDVTRLQTLRSAAKITGHQELLKLIEEIVEELKADNCARVGLSMLNQHTTRESCWVVIDRKVYDVTPFLPLHPGGEDLIVKAAGYDATGVFEMTHGEGLRYSLRILNQFFIGFLADGVQLPPYPDSDPPSPEFLVVLRKITSALHDIDEENATGENQTRY